MKHELAKFGLGASEQEILLFLLRFGSRPGGVISQKLNLKRSTVYSALENLIKRKLATKESINRNFFFAAIPAEKIPLILMQEEEHRLAQLRFSVETLTKSLTAYAGKGKAKSRHFEFEWVESTSRYMEIQTELNTRDHFAIWDPNTGIYDDKIKKAVLKYIKKSDREKNTVKEILYRGPMTSWYVSNIKNPNHSYRILDSKVVTHTDFTVYAEDIAFISMNTPHDESALLIHSKDLFLFGKQLFDLIWKTLPAQKVKK